MVLGISKGEDRVTEVSGAEQTLPGNAWRQHLGILIPILLIFFSLAFYHIGHQSLWTDEVISVMRADPNGPFLTRERWFSGQSPPYFLLLHLWANWGTSEFALRSLSALLGAVTVCLGYLTARQFCNRRVACIGATLLATSPFLIWYSQEVRYVILMIPAALLAMYTFARALSAKRLGWWLCYSGSLVLAIVVFAVNVLLLVAQGLYLVGSSYPRPVLRRWVACQLVLFALFIWWTNQGHIWQLGGYWQKLSVQATTNSEQMASMDPNEHLFAGISRQFTLMALPYTFFVFSTGFSLGPSPRELHVSRSLETLLPSILIISISGLLFGTLFILGITALGRQSETRKFLLSWLAIPIMGVLSISALIPSLAYNVRYVAMAFPAYVLILAVGIASLRRPLVQMTFFSAVLAVNGLSLANYYHNPRYSREDARSTARYLEAKAHAGDIIALVGNATAVRYYYKGSLPLVSWGKATFDSQAALADSLQVLSKDHEQLWLVEIRPWEANLEGMVKAALDERHQLIEHKELSGVDIYLYQLR